MVRVGVQEQSEGQQQHGLQIHLEVNHNGRKPGTAYTRPSYRHPWCLHNMVAQNTWRKKIKFDDYYRRKQIPLADQITYIDIKDAHCILGNHLIQVP